LPQPWRKWLREELASRRAKLQTDMRSATLWRPWAVPKTIALGTRPANSQEHHHAYS
jgi:hypothetical protein